MRKKTYTMKKHRTLAEKPLIGRLGSEAFLALTHRKAGTIRTDKRDVSRAVAKRRAIAEG
jgi:hypothetical protein